MNKKISGKTKEIVIEELSPENVNDVNTCNGEFSIDAKLALYMVDNQIRYEVVNTPVSKKKYEFENMDYHTYLDDPNKTVFFARINQQITGQVILRQNWNAFGYIEDIVVDVPFRRLGIGRLLISKAVQWARENHLAGIMLETQNNNVSACQFYEKCGFRIGGFDLYFYQGQDPTTDEIALFWYLLFGERR